MVAEPDQDIQGVASTWDMSMVFTCQFLKCVIECPCQVCRASRNICCKSRHSQELCKRCMPQCNQHKLKVPYLFDPATDLFTIVSPRTTLPMATLECPQTANNVLWMFWNIKFCIWSNTSFADFVDLKADHLSSSREAKVLKHSKGLSKS